MSLNRAEVVEHQAELVALLLHHVHTPFAEQAHLRGVLPGPRSAESIRIVVGPRGSVDRKDLVAYEFPLRTDGEHLTAHHLVGQLRTLLSRTRLHSGSRVGETLGMLLVPVDPRKVPVAPPVPEDEVLRMLRTLAAPLPVEAPGTRLCGFLALSEDRLRLYLSAEDFPDVIAADTRTSGAVTALLAALPSLITETERWTVDTADPHCAHLVDLTHW
ncbi:hypothetical protein ACSMX9_17360 [Streptomyces sp. LE64]|uniref:hypothetical protein n=1 Tax=Streptomyces sp. LE64 TaxID=3448653 RepID=UPI004042C7C4